MHNNSLQIQSGKILKRSSDAEKPAGLAIVFHGYGADAENLLDVVTQMSLAIPSVQFIVPNGIQRFEGCDGAYQWFSLRDFTQQYMQQGLSKVAPQIANWILQQLEMYEITNDRLSLVGFSQGAILSLYLTAANLLQPNKIIAYSGLFVPPSVQNQNAKMQKDTSVCIMHGSADTVIPIQMAQPSYHLLKQYGITKSEIIIEHGLQHGISQHGITKGISFITST